jgi:hypothetical protein
VAPKNEPFLTRAKACRKPLTFLGVPDPKPADFGLFESRFEGGYNRGSVSCRPGIPPMALDLETIVKQLEDSGITAVETLDDFVPPKASPKDGDELVHGDCRFHGPRAGPQHQVRRSPGRYL